MRSTAIFAAIASLASCASPETVIEVTRDPATGIVTGRIDRSWLGGECYVTGTYKAPDGTLIEFSWASDVDLSAALADRADARQRITDAAKTIADAASKVP
jgi:hypothetical protein